MSYSFVLHDYWSVGLAVFLSHHAFLSAEVEEIFCEFEVFLIACYAVHLHESHFHDLVTWFVGESAFEEVFYEQVGVLDCYVEKCALAC